MLWQAQDTNKEPVEAEVSTVNKKNNVINSSSGSDSDAEPPKQNEVSICKDQIVNRMLWSLVSRNFSPNTLVLGWTEANGGCERQVGDLIFQFSSVL